MKLKYLKTGYIPIEKGFQNTNITKYYNYSKNFK